MKKLMIAVVLMILPSTSAFAYNEARCEAAQENVKVLCKAPMNRGSGSAAACLGAQAAVAFYC